MISKKSINKIFLHSTYSCNANCIHCAVPRIDKFISFETYLNLINLSHKNGVNYIIIGGGEPLSHPRIKDMISYAFDNDLKVKIETNGKLLTKSFLNEIKDKLFQLNVSLDGCDKTTHNKIRGINTFNHTLKMIKYARSLGIDVAIWTVVIKANVDEIPSLIELVKSCDVDKVCFLYATPVQNCYVNKESILVDKVSYWNLLKKVIEKDSEDFQVRIAPYIIPKTDLLDFQKHQKLTKKDLNCLIIDKEILHVDPYGDIYPCVLLLHNKKFILGNISDSKLLTKLLERDNVVWDKIISKLEIAKEPAGCIGLCDSYNSEKDYRFDLGIPVCPCKTINREWKF